MFHGDAARVDLEVRQQILHREWVLQLEVRDAGTGATPSRGQAWRRFFFSGVSYLPFLAGYLMALFQRQGLALHDVLAGTRVVSRSKS